MVFFFQAEDGIRDLTVTGVQTCALPIFDDEQHRHAPRLARGESLLREAEALQLLEVLARRSEEHTSELQSQSNLVCRLLLEKKNSKVAYDTRQIPQRFAHRCHAAADLLV